MRTYFWNIVLMGFVVAGGACGGGGGKTSPDGNPQGDDAAAGGGAGGRGGAAGSGGAGGAGGGGAGGSGGAGGGGAGGGGVGGGGPGGRGGAGGGGGRGGAGGAAGADAGAPDFTVTVMPMMVSVGLGTSRDTSVRVQFMNGFTSARVDLAVSGLPANVTGTFAPTALPHDGTAVLTISTTASAAPGTYPLTITATSEGMMRTVSGTLVIFAAPDFTLAVSPGTQSVAAGGSVTYTLTAAAVNGFSSPVMLAAAGLPAGATASFSPNPVTPTATSTLTVTTTAATPVGTSTLTITGTGGTGSVTATLVVTAAGGGMWVVSNLGPPIAGEGYNSVLVGPGRNDGVNRVYGGTTRMGRVLEFTYSGGAWSAPAVVLNAASGYSHNLTMGPGRNDGRTRLYVANANEGMGGTNSLYELTYNSGPGTWSTATVDTPADGTAFHVVVGDGRTDGTNRVYGAYGRRPGSTTGNAIYEYTWNGTTMMYDRVRVDTTGAAQYHGLALGRGRGDTTNRLYAAGLNGTIYEFTFSGGSWAEATVAAVGDSRRNCGLGAGRGDGVMRLYSAGSNGTIREHSWSAGSWTTVTVGMSMGGAALVHSKVAAGRNDGMNRVYSASGAGTCYEYSFPGWNRRTMGGASGVYMYGLDPGIGRNDGMVRVYGGAFDGRIYELTWQP